jgi:hypothetical protein
MKKQYRQGDVLLEKVDTIPAQSKPVKEKVIAFGESSDHCHRVTDNVDVLESNGETFLHVNTKGRLEHVRVSDPLQWTGEHHPIELPPGNYKVIRQKEYDPYEKHARAVQD